MKSAFTNGNTNNTNTAITITTTLTGQTVAPVYSTTTAAPTTFGTVRVGSSATASLVVKNSGDGNKAGADDGTTVLTNLRGNVGAVGMAGVTGGGAVNLTDGASQSYTFTYAPTARGAISGSLSAAMTNGAVTGTNAASTINSAISGTAVGPVYDAKVNSQAIGNGGNITYLGWGGANVQTQDLLISNITTDTATGNLTNLSLTFSIIGDATKEFQLSFDGGATYGTGGSTTLGKALTQGIKVQFTNKVVGGDGYAQLKIATDEGAAFGGAGAIYIYNLAAVPEPGTLVVLGSGLLGLVAMRRRARANATTVSSADAEKAEA